MTLSLGARLGPYEILSALGAGGMGEVYRARDARLERDVAIRVLPSSFSAAAAADRLVVGDSDNAPIEMIVNWPALLKKPN